MLGYTFTLDKEIKAIKYTLPGEDGIVVYCYSTPEALSMTRDYCDLPFLEIEKRNVEEILKFAKEKDAEFHVAGSLEFCEEAIGQKLANLDSWLCEKATILISV